MYWHWLTYIIIYLLSSDASKILYDGVERYRHVCRVMYDGRRFKGWQDQNDPDQRTVQGTIGQHMSKRFNVPIKVTGASRTDHGVHSRGQVIHFDIPSLLYETNQFEYSINRLLPDDIKLYNTSIAPLGNPSQVLLDESFHATKSANSKLYAYRFCTNKYVDPMKRHHCIHAYFPVNLDKLNTCLQYFIGSHDFRAFSNRIERSVKDFDSKDIEFSTIRQIYSITLNDEGGGYYRVDFHIQSALYRMIRNIMATAFDVASGRFSVEWMLHLLHDAPSRIENKSRSAPPEGLCLEHVYYDNY
jgi:tRNA pseudouridine38-40 synthase